MGRWGILAALIALGSCSFGTEFNCEGDEQCALRSSGQCEGDGWCSYPDEDCASGRVYGPYAPPGIADACVDPSGASSGMTTTTSTTGDDGSGSTGDPPVPACGNGVVDEGEDCDDGNNLPDDGCHPLCVEPYRAAWTQEYNETDREDRGFAVDVDADNDAVYVVGLTQTSDDSSNDLLVQRYGLTDGVRVWSWSRDTTGFADTAEQVVVDAKGDVVVAGVETDAAEVNQVWLAKFDPDGEVIYDQRNLAVGKAEGVTIADDGRIVAAGRTGSLGSSLAFVQWYAPNTGAPDGDPVYFGDDEERGDAGIDIINVPKVGVQVTGNRFANDTPNLWTARVDPSGALLWEDLIPDPDGDAPRGVGQALSPLGGTAMVGTRNTDRFVQFYDDAGMPTRDPWEEGESGQDEVADIAFLDDGRYVLVGFIGFNLSDTGTADGWIRFNEPDGTLIEQFPVSGTGGGLDKLLAVENAPHSVVVTGYVRNENSGIDLWLRRYAI